MKVAILGSTGFVGKVLLEKSLEKGYQVTTLVRNPDKLGDFKGKVKFIQGDVLQTNKLEEIVSGSDVVISTVPPQEKTKDPEKHAKVMEDLIAALEKNSIKRFIHIGGAVHGGGENENWTTGRKFLRLFLNLVWKAGLIGKEQEWEALKKSNMNWTLVRPPRITKGKPKGNLIADEKNLARTQVSVEDLVDFILDQVNSEKWFKKAPLVASPE